METWYGLVKTPADAIKLFEACRLGILPRVQRRLSEKERQQIRAGSVFVWDEREAGMRRWTDGKSWSASRVAGSFLTYREMEGKRGVGFGSTTTTTAGSTGRKGSASGSGSGKTPEARTSDEEQDDAEPDGYRYKTNGLMKQSFSITTNMGNHLHLISYSSRHQPGEPQLMTPSADSMLASVQPSKGMYPESSLGETSQGPAFTRTPMQAYPIHHHPQHHPHPIHYGHPQQHHQYSLQHPYQWPPSPLPTPHYTHAPQYHHGITPYQQQPAQQQQPQLPRPYKPDPHYDRVSLPPLQPHHQQQQQHQQQQHSRPAPPQPAQSLPRPHVSPTPHHEDPSSSASAYSLAMRAAQAITSPNATISELGPSLPPITTMSQSPRRAAPSSVKVELTPSPRQESESPPRTANSDMHATLAPIARSATGISTLLHPSAEAATNGTPHSGSAGSSPRTILSAPVMTKRPPGISEDLRAVNVLNKNFRFSV